MNSFGALIIGGGIAGASCAFSLARRGLTTVVCEARLQVGDRASGNPYGILMPYLTTSASQSHALYAAGFAYSHQLLTKALGDLALLRECGAIQLPATQRLHSVMKSTEPILAPSGIMRLSMREGTERAGIALQSPALFVANAGYLSPRSFINALLQQTTPQSVVRTTCRVVSLMRGDHQWRAHLEDGEEITAKYVIVCGAYESATIAQTAWLPLEPIRGQTTRVVANTISKMLKTVICFSGYIIPNEAGEHLLGAHYRHHDIREESSPEDTAEILSRCHRWLPQMNFATPTGDAARVCFRTSTFDRLPYIGAVPDFTAMHRESASYQPGSDLLKRIPLRTYPDLFISAGHGSRGLITCPIAGEIIARLISNEPLAELSIPATICTPSRAVFRAIQMATTD